MKLASFLQYEHTNSPRPNSAKNNVFGWWGITIIGLALILGISACFQPDEFPVEPAITNIWFDTAMVKSFEGQFEMYIGFRDGDGDLGRRDSNDQNNIFIYDNRDADPDRIPTSYAMPNVDVLGNGDDVSGYVRLKLSECCYPGIPCFPGQTYPTPTDTLSYDVIITDRAGHVSNLFRSPTLTLVCN